MNSATFKVGDTVTWRPDSHPGQARPNCRYEVLRVHRNKGLALVKVIRGTSEAMQGTEAILKADMLVKAQEAITLRVDIDYAMIQRMISDSIQSSLGTVEAQLERLLADATEDKNWGAVEFLGKKLREFKDIADKYEV